MMARVEGLSMLFYAPTTYPGQGTAQEVRPGLVDAMLMRSRTLHGHAPWTPSGALTANLHVLTCDKLCPERLCGCRALVYECIHLS